MHGSRAACLVALLTAGALLSGCNGSSPTDPAAGVAPRSGDWQGMTGQGKPISFSVSGTAQSPRLTRYEISIQIDELVRNTGPLVCLFSESTVTVAPANVPIVGGGFVVEVGGLDSTIRFEGMFDSAVSASGTLTADTLPNATCQGRGRTTWQAQPV